MVFLHHSGLAREEQFGCGQRIGIQDEEPDRSQNRGWSITDRMQWMRIGDP